MKQIVQYGFPTRPPWARNFVEGILVRLHRTPKHMKKVLAREDEILLRSKSVLDLLTFVHTDCDIEVHWPEQHIRIMYGKDCIGTVTFDELLNPNSNAKFIADHILSCINR